MLHLERMWKEVVLSAVATVALLLLVSGAYPLVVWGLAQTCFRAQAQGSLIPGARGPAGSELLGQAFTTPRYFHGRPSAAGNGYDAANSGGSNLGPASKALLDSLAARADRYRKENGLSPGSILPADAVTASASGLDPDISPENAGLQAARVAQVRHLDPEAVRRLVEARVQGRQWGLFGEPRVNVLRLNLALDGSMGK